MTMPYRPGPCFPFVLCALLLAASGAAAPAGAGGGKAVKEDRPVRAGDALVVSIRDLEGPGKNTIVELDVNDDGRIALPMLRTPVGADGLSTDKLRDAIAKAYRQGRLLQNAAVTVKFAPGKPNGGRTLRVGDGLVVSIRDLEGPGKNTIVKADIDPKGEIKLPMLSKPVPAKGLTREKLCDAIVKAYERDGLIANALVTVRLRNAEKTEPQAPKE